MPAAHTRTDGATAQIDHASITSSHAQRLAHVFGFRALIYTGVFLSGAVALSFQIVWQRYLAVLVGGEARSASLVVAVFLLGLASGYQFWGRFTQGRWSRRAIVKAVGFAEIGIAAYALVFPQFFPVVRDMIYAAPNWLAIDFLAALALLFLPTFLMGASIPLLTAAVPGNPDEVNYCHSRIYGLNTLGAFLGALVGGFYLVPTFGLSTTLLIGALVDIAVGFAFLLNRLEGPAHQARDIPRIPHSFGRAGIYLFVFVTGAASIGFEMLFMRAIGLAIGSGHYVFPIVVGVVVLGLAIGSLSIRKAGVTAERVPRDLMKLGVMLGVLYLTVPHWPYWLSHVRISLATIPSNYPVFLTLVVLFACLLLLPVVIPMGRLLPIGYALIDKTREDYGRLCGQVYFINTIGTVVGAVVIGYVLFLFLDMDWIFKLNIAMMLGLGCVLLIRSGRAKTAAVCAALAIAALILPRWNRQHHYGGVFRVTTLTNMHFQGFFSIPERISPANILLAKDDPNLSVAAYKYEALYRATGEVLNSKSIAVNGKSDGNTVADYSNMVLTGLLPYLYAHREGNLNAAVIGLGTGMTSGALALAEDVQSVTTLEISSAVIEALPHFDDGNFELSKNPKSRVVQTDAFRFLARARTKFDVISSEPSNPWVAGVDSLFTADFYRLVSNGLNEGGMFFQWIQLYEIDNLILSAIIQNLVNEFPHVSLFAIGPQDIGVLASHAPLDAPHLVRRMEQPGVQHALRPMSIDDPAHVAVLEMLQTAQLRAASLGNVRGIHQIETPWLGHAAGKAHFLETAAQPTALMPREVGRHTAWSHQRLDAVLNWVRDHHADLSPWCTPSAARHSNLFFCDILKGLGTRYEELTEPVKAERAGVKLTAYGFFRDRGYGPPDLPLLEQIERAVLENPEALEAEQLNNFARDLVLEYAYEWQWDKARSAAAAFSERNIITLNEMNMLHQQIDDISRTGQAIGQMLKVSPESNPTFR